MSIKKVLLQPLERLDLVDIQGIQDIIHDQVSRLLGGLITSGFGLLKMWGTPTINNTNHTIDFGAFSYFSRIISGSDTTQGTVCVFDPTLGTNSECDFSSYYATVNAYYQANSTLPPNPLSDTFISGTHGQYYPFLWCKRVLLDGETENRRFWSIIEATEIVQAIATRQTESTMFLVSHTDPSDLFDDGEAWCIIGRVTKWIISGGVPALDSTCLTPYFLADDLVNNSRTDPKTWIQPQASMTYGGIKQGLSYLRDRLDTMLQSISTLSDDFIAFKNKKKRGFVVVKHILNLGEAQTLSFSVISNTQDDFSSTHFTVVQDYEPVYALGGIVAPYTPENLNVSDSAVRASMANYVVLVPQTYDGILFQAIINTVIPMTGVDFSDGSVMSLDDFDTRGFDILLDGSSINTNIANKISLVTYKDKDNTQRTGYGFKIRRRDFKNAQYAKDQYNIAMLSLDITIG